MNKPSRFGNQQAGFSMIEVLVTVVILLVGLLGLAALQANAQRAEFESYQRVQAIILMQDMAQRINTNRKNAAAYQNVSVGGTANPTCPGASRAERDICDWHNVLKGAAETTGSGAGLQKLGAMIGARGCVTYDAANQIYRVSVAWQGMASTAAPVAALTCGQNQYGDETMRRVVSIPLRIGTLL